MRSNLTEPGDASGAENDKLSLIADIAANYLRRNSIGVEQIGAVISSVTSAIEGAARRLAGGPAGEEAPSQPSASIPAEKPKPAVPIKKSVHKDFVVCLEDGFQGKTLKRHLRVAHDMSPQQYREKWGLRRDHPIVAPVYSESRSAMAKQLGLGTKMREARAKNARKRPRSTKAA